MSSFSERYGHTKTEKIFQLNQVDQVLRTKIWNILNAAVWQQYDPQGYSQTNDRINQLVKILWVHYFGKDLDELPFFRYHGNGAYDFLKTYFFRCQWFDVYNFLEEIVKIDGRMFSVVIRDGINKELELNNAAYRFVDDKIMQITDENEIQAIEDGLTDADAPVREHLQTSLHMLSDREHPDYRNSIKESISAVEAACKILTGNKSATLNKALKDIGGIHPVLKSLFDRFYAYAGDEEGVRHSLFDESKEEITYAEAKYMLVSCAAFISYLKMTVKAA